jgi:protein-S-isoprenylcysteine O-methyltransferase Ste14
MRISTVILIIAATIYLIIEGGLILRDRNNTKGTTKIDRMTRIFNIISIEIALCSPLFSIFIPTLQFDSREISTITWIGTSLICLGFVLRYWSIIVLGKYFRTTVEIEKGHKVIQKGAYRFIRHPSYSGIMLFFIGYGLISQNWLSLVFAVLLPTIALLYRINVEEEAFVKEIGTEYVNYQSRTKKLIPGIW